MTRSLIASRYGCRDIVVNATSRSSCPEGLRVVR
jgi:hypothetical protein